MNNLSNNIINNKIILYSALIAIGFHISLIPISSMIKLKKIEEIEPKIILELINDFNENIQIVNNIKPPEIIKPKEIIKPSTISPPKNIKLESIENTIQQIDIFEEIILPENIKPIINNKIDIPQNIKKLNTDLSIDKLPSIIKPEQIILNKKPLKTINKPDYSINSELLEPTRLNDNLIQQNTNLPDKPVKKEVINKEITQDTEIENNILTRTEINTLEKYKSNIRSIIQAFAINNYPRKDLRRKNEGIVHIIFKLKTDGDIEYIKTGPNTDASKSLIDAAITSVRKSAPFEQIKLLKKQREFEINIIYKIN